jgi:hypothetical protein
MKLASARTRGVHAVKKLEEYRKSKVVDELVPTETNGRVD